ncbi:MAG: TerB family tellurite resistance protein [Myxococcota bacterium]
MTTDKPQDGPRAKAAIQRPGDRVRRRAHAVEPDQESHVMELTALGELMLGAAFADGVKVAVETIAIAEQLKEFVAASDLPPYVADRLDRFDPKAFSIEEAVRHIKLRDDDDRQAVLTLVARVTYSDQVMHPAETVYLRRVATALGLDPDTITITVK